MKSNLRILGVNILFVLCLLSFETESKTTYMLTDFGAKADGVTLKRFSGIDIDIFMQKSFSILLLLAYLS